MFVCFPEVEFIFGFFFVIVLYWTSENSSFMSVILYSLFLNLNTTVQKKKRKRKLVKEA